MIMLSHDNPPREPLRIAIIGGGISGLAAAERVAAWATRRPPQSS